jgi:hypothetical protein
MENNSGLYIEVDEPSTDNNSRTPLSLKNTNLVLPNKKNKRKNTSLVHEYFTKYTDSVSGDEICVCTFLDEKGNRCGKSYRNVGSSTGNLLHHLETHQIYSNNNKKVCKLFIHILLFNC